MAVCLFIFFLLVCFPQAVLTCGSVSPEFYQQSLSEGTISAIDETVERAIAERRTPGAVILVGHQGKVIFERAYGNRSLESRVEPMSLDTVFDLASLTKVVATATSMMILVERGLVRLGDPVSRYIPEFGESGKKNITVEQLLIHRSGLIADNDIKDYEQGPDEAMRNVWKLAANSSHDTFPPFVRMA